MSSIHVVVSSTDTRGLVTVLYDLYPPGVHGYFSNHKLVTIRTQSFNYLTSPYNEGWLQWIPIALQLLP